MKKHKRKSLRKKSATRYGAIPTPIIILVVIVILAAVAGFFVLQFLNKGSSPLSALPIVNQLTQPKVDESLFADIDDPLIRKQFAAQINKRAYRTRSSSSGLGEGESVMEIDYKNENDVRFRTTTIAQGKTQSDMIVIGDTTYVLDTKDNTWWMQKAKPLATADSQEPEDDYKPEDLKEELLKKTKLTYKNLGEEDCGGGLICHKYEEIDPQNPENKRTFWFDKKELLLRKETSGFGEFSSTIVYSYDNINIAAPSPTKQVPEGKSIYEMSNPYLDDNYQGQVPSKEEIDKMQKELNSIQNMPVPEFEDTDEKIVEEQ